MTGSSGLWARPAHAPAHLREGRGAGPQRHEAASQPPPAPGPGFPSRAPGSPEPAPGLPSWPPRLSRHPHWPCGGRPWWLPAAQACLLACPVPCCVLRASKAQALPLTWGNPQDLLQTPSPTGTLGVCLLGPVTRPNGIYAPPGTELLTGSLPAQARLPASTSSEPRTHGPVAPHFPARFRVSGQAASPDCPWGDLMPPERQPPSPTCPWGADPACVSCGPCPSWAGGQPKAPRRPLRQAWRSCVRRAGTAL